MRTIHRSMLVLSALLACGTAAAQGLGHAPLAPPGGLPALPSVGALARGLGDPLQAPLDHLRRLQVRELLRTQRARVDVDPRGEPVLRGEFLAIAPDDAAVAAIRAAGFEPTPAGDDGAPLGLDIRIVHDLRGRPATRAMRALQAAAPRTQFAFQHLYLPAGSAAAAGDAPVAPVAPAGSARRIGLVDGGVDAHTPALAQARVLRHGCNGAAFSQAHGSLVADRLVDGGAATLYAADLWCGEAVGRATLGLVDALAWMARERVPVVNISLVGPDNPVLARAVQAMVARGHVLVAAVGNDGPAAPPLYPAAYPGVVGVGGVDARLRVLPESASGAQVDFTAPGIVGAGPHAARGTSFASPVAARLAAAVVADPGTGAVDLAMRALAAQARDQGPRGRDARYGEGVVGAP